MARKNLISFLIFLDKPHSSKSETFKMNMWNILHTLCSARRPQVARLEEHTLPWVWPWWSLIPSYQGSCRVEVEDTGPNPMGKEGSVWCVFGGGCYRCGQPLCSGELATPQVWCGIHSFPPQSQQRQRCERELKTGAVPRPPDFRLWFDLQPLAPANRALNLKATFGVLGASPNLINRRGGQHMEVTLARRWCREAGRELKGVSAVMETEDVGEGAVRSSKQRKVAEDFLEQEW